LPPLAGKFDTGVSPTAALYVTPPVQREDVPGGPPAPLLAVLVAHDANVTVPPQTAKTCGAPNAALRLKGSVVLDGWALVQPGPRSW
jgi:hypothetical protein